MHISENVDLKPLNTFGLSVRAKYLAEISVEEEITELVQSDLFLKNKRFILGGGSNVLVTEDFDGLVVKNNIKGRSVVKETEEDIWIAFGGGEVWHEIVLYAVGNNWGGIENMSLIPGTVGAAPMQNIGAYGAEIKDVFESLEAINLETGARSNFKHSDCEFGYRQSVFKGKLKGQYFISSVTLRLSKKPKVNTGYGAIKDVLKKVGVINPGIREVSNAVISIRQSKLPDPGKIGNAGSFFKNPTIDKQKFDALRKSFPDIVGYPNEEGVKVPAGWLIEKAGWKGRKIGAIGVHEHQALVLVNYGKGNGKDIFDLSEQIKQSIYSTFGIDLEREVNIL